MKKINLFVILLAAILMPFLIISCDKEQENEEPNNTSFKELILGKWYVTSYIEEGEYEGEIYKEEFDYPGNWCWSFDADDILKIYTEGEYDGSYEYEVVNEKIYSNFVSEWFELEYVTIKELTSETLSLVLRYSDEEGWIQVTYNFERTSNSTGDEENDDEGEQEETVSYYIKHPWNGEDWTWKLMAQEDESYTYVGTWNGIGANINTSADDDGSAWYPLEDIYGADEVTIGSTVTFMFLPYEGVDGSLIISTKESDNGDDNNGSGDDNNGDDNNGSGDDNGEGNTPTESLDKPSNVRATLDGESSIKVTWSSVSGASGYYVYRSSSANGYYEKIGDRHQTSYYDNSPLEGSNYYKIKAYNASMTSEYSEYALCTYSKEEEITKPNAPTGVSAEAYSSYIKITWNYVNGADSYKVYRSTSANGTYSSLQTTSSTSYTDYDASEGTTYYYKVTAINSAGESNKSSYASAKIEPQVSKPNTPTGVYATFTGSAQSPQIKISWNSVEDATSYKVYRATSSSGSYYQVGSATPSTYLYDSNPKEGKNYYKVKALNSAGESQYSEYAEASYEPYAYPPEPTSLKLTKSGDGLKMKWTYETGPGFGKPTSVEILVKDPDTGELYRQDILPGTETTYTITGNVLALNTDFEYHSFVCGVNLINEYGEKSIGAQWDTQANVQRR